MVDDVAINGKLLQFAFHKFIGAGWEVTNMCTPEEALEAVRTKAFDLIIMDEIFSQEEGSMRGSDAIRAIRRIEESTGEDGTSSVRAIIVICSGTVDCLDGAPAVFMDCGADAIWSKPFPSGPGGSLWDALDRLFSARAAPLRRAHGTASPLATRPPRGPSSPRGPSPVPSPLRQSTICVPSPANAASSSPAERTVLPSSATVLVADDVVLFGKLLELSFHKFIGAGWEVTHVYTPEAALETVRTKAFDLIIMDEVFSHEEGSMRGSDAIRAIRRIEKSKGRTSDNVDGVEREWNERAIIVLCSGFDLSGEASRLEEDAVVDAIWSKPCPNGADGSLWQELARLFSSREA